METEVRQEDGGWRQTGRWGMVRQEDGGWRLRSDRKMGDGDWGQTGRWGIQMTGQRGSWGMESQTGRWGMETEVRGMETEVRQEDGGWRLRSDRKMGDTDD